MYKEEDFTNEDELYSYISSSIKGVKITTKKFDECFEHKTSDRIIETNIFGNGELGREGEVYSIYSKDIEKGIYFPTSLCRTMDHIIYNKMVNKIKTILGIDNIDNNYIKYYINKAIFNEEFIKKHGAKSSYNEIKATSQRGGYKKSRLTIVTNIGSIRVGGTKYENEMYVSVDDGWNITYSGNGYIVKQIKLSVKGENIALFDDKYEVCEKY